MKTILIYILLLCSIGGMAQETTIQTEVGTNTNLNQSYALMAGFNNFQDDGFHAGLLYKRYGNMSRKGLRFNVDLTLNRFMFIFIQGDVFANTGKEDNSSFLENSVGLGFNITKNLSAAFGYQMEDYDPVTTIRTEDLGLGKVIYKFRL